MYLILQREVIALVKPISRNLQGIHDEVKEPVMWFILVINQLDAQNFLFYKKFTFLQEIYIFTRIFFYMFRAHVRTYARKM